jgi:CDP-6-deoxy-D-xylo-4-hexulose-3-dehydrase
MNCIDSLLTLRLTMGKKVEAFEEAWAKYLGSKHCIMTNSGSSANLLALLAATRWRWPRKAQSSHIITSPVTFPTSVYPIVQVGCHPVFVDVEPDTFNMDPCQVEKAVSNKIGAILPVHFMGMPCAMKHIMEIAEENELYVIEDTAESHGAKIDGKHAGTFGHEGTFSFFFSHHISTIEGGAVATDQDYLADTIRSLRSYGWIRTLNANLQEEIMKGFDKIDPRHLYIEVGYNFKPTELNAALGIGQIERIEATIATKQRIARHLTEELSWLSDELILPLPQKDGRTHVYLGYPVVAKPTAPFDKFHLMNYLEKHSIETRQLEAGDVTLQPSAQHYTFTAHGNLTNAKTAMRGGLFFGLHDGITPEDEDYIIKTFEQFFREKPWEVSR